MADYYVDDLLTPVYQFELFNHNNSNYLIWVLLSERETERDTERHRETEGERQRETERDTERETERERGPPLTTFEFQMILSLTDEKNSTKEIWRKIILSAKAKAQIQWWINDIDNSCHHINISNSDITIYTDESLADGVSLMVYPHPGDSGIRQC